MTKDSLIELAEKLMIQVQNEKISINEALSTFYTAQEKNVDQEKPFGKIHPDKFRHSRDTIKPTKFPI